LKMEVTYWRSGYRNVLFKFICKPIVGKGKVMNRCQMPPSTKDEELVLVSFIVITVNLLLIEIVFLMVNVLLSVNLE